MKTFFYKFYHSFPVQLLLLHIRKYQILLVFWYILFSTVNGSFAKLFGAVSLFLAPEYLGRVSFYSMLIMGITLGTFIMSWNITTFILHSKRFKFLATTTQPFFRYCLNNFTIPLAFVAFFIYKLILYQRYEELTDMATVFLLIEGFILGVLFIVFTSFLYFFNADKTILRALQRRMGGPRKILLQIMTKEAQEDEDALPVLSYLNTPFLVRRARKVDHYNKHFLAGIFRQHHFAAVITIGVAFLFVLILSYFISSPDFRIPAGASVLLFFTVLIGLSGAFAYMFRGWSIPIIILMLILINWSVKNEWIDTRSKAYGLDYQNRAGRPVYSLESFNKIFTRQRANEDAQQTLQILEKWKNRCSDSAGKPKLIIINVSGGGSRAAMWSMDVLQRADSLLNGRLMKNTVLITGASGGMLAATYFRELYWEKEQGEKIDLYNPQYTDNISKDLLNAVFSYYAVNDFFTPFQFFRIDNNSYAKDRGYAFEQQFDLNTGNVLDKTIGYYETPEKKALIPMIIFSATVTADGRNMLISPQPVSYLTAPEYLYPNRKIRDIDGIDFCEFFNQLHPKQLRVTNALRMSATFPYILPNVYLPSVPIVDVMDAGLRDNYGQETSLRFLHVFRKWINENTSGVIFIQVRDSRKNEITPIEPEKDLADLIFEPLFTVQKNWASFQDYYEDDMVSYAEHFLHIRLDRIIFQYVPRQENNAAALNWHLTSREKSDINGALDNVVNQSAFRYLVHVMNE
jgi:Patatin-like phospholipase